MIEKIVTKFLNWEEVKIEGSPTYYRSEYATWKIDFTERDPRYDPILFDPIGDFNHTRILLDKLEEYNLEYDLHRFKDNAYEFEIYGKIKYHYGRIGFATNTDIGTVICEAIIDMIGK